jgi:hypothetical protein
VLNTDTLDFTPLRIAERVYELVMDDAAVAKGRPENRRLTGPPWVGHMLRGPFLLARVDVAAGDYTDLDAADEALLAGYFAGTVCGVMAAPVVYCTDRTLIVDLTGELVHEGKR